MDSVLQINASTVLNRHAAVQQVHAALTGAGAWVTDYRQFSNSSACISFEVAGARISEIERGLSGIGLAISERSLEQLRRLWPEAVLSGSVQITFFHSEGDLRVTVPAVPG